EELAELLIGEAGLLGLEQDAARAQAAAVGLHAVGRLREALDLVQEPAVDVRQLVDAIDRHARRQRRRDGKNALVGRMAQLLFQFAAAEMSVADEAVHADLEHAQGLLQRLFELAADSHDLADRLHTRADALRRHAELLQIPARYLHDDVIQRRLKT